MGSPPYVAVFVGTGVQVPMEYVKNNEIVLNVGFEATSGLKLGNDFIEFKARFGGVAREILVPIDHVVAIYARENGQGMAFPMPAEANAGGEGSESARGGDSPDKPLRGLRLASSDSQQPDVEAEPAPDDEPEGPAPIAPNRPSLKRIK